MRHKFLYVVGLKNRGRQAVTRYPTVPAAVGRRIYLTPRLPVCSESVLCLNLLVFDCELFETESHPLIVALLQQQRIDKANEDSESVQSLT